jgi:tetratricopeptide (TPR) repeat protein
MNGTRKTAGLAIAAALCLMLGNALGASAQAPAAGQDTGAGKPPAYTMAEYNAYQACAAEKTPGPLIKCLDDFTSKYPNSGLSNFVYNLYMQAYSATKNYQKVIENADKLAALPTSDASTKFNAYYAHAAAYSAIITSDPKNLGQDPNLAKAAITTALAGLKTLDDVKKPDGVTDEAWAKKKTEFQIFLNGIAAQASLTLKDNQAAIQYYKAVLTLNPDDAVASYNLGKAYLAMTPPQTMDGFWAIARAVTSKGATEAQSKSVKTYLRKLIANYQGGNVCESLIDAELNELLQLAGSSPARPDTYKMPSSADLDAARKDMTIASVVADLKAGGDKGKITWLASCGLEFPDVPGKLIETTPGDPLVLKVAFVTSDAEFDAATVPNMEVKVVGQPEAARLEKDNPVRFTGTLVAYDPDPAFMLHWEKAKVNAEDIPKEKGAPKKPTRRPPAKKPSGSM